MAKTPPSDPTSQYPSGGGVHRHPGDRRVQSAITQRAVEAGPAQGEDAAIRCGHEVPRSGRIRGGGGDVPGEMAAEQRAPDRSAERVERPGPSGEHIPPRGGEGGHDGCGDHRPARRDRHCRSGQAGGPPGRAVGHDGPTGRSGRNPPRGGAGIGEAPRQRVTTTRREPRPLACARRRGSRHRRAAGLQPAVITERRGRLRIDSYGHRPGDDHRRDRRKCPCRPHACCRAPRPGVHLFQPASRNPPSRRRAKE